MAGSLNDILPEPISEEAERILLDHMKRKMKNACGIAVWLLHAMEERFGPEARQVVKDRISHREVTPRPDPGDPEEERRTQGNHKVQRR